jgi:hypothetical protein
MVAAKSFSDLGSQANDDDLGPCCMIAPKFSHALDVEQSGAKPIRTFQYMFLSVMSEMRPDEFWFVFEGEEGWKLTVKGRNLRPVYDKINDHRLRRIRAVDRDFNGNDGKPVITGIELTKIEKAEP